MDRRDSLAAKWWTKIDERAMTCESKAFDDDSGEEVQGVDVPFRWAVCPTCDGRGSHVDPNVDRNGITEDDWSQMSDEDRAQYLGGAYDVKCRLCDGRRVVPEATEEADKTVCEHIARGVQADADYERLCDAERRMGA